MHKCTPSTEQVRGEGQGHWTERLEMCRCTVRVREWIRKKRCKEEGLRLGLCHYGAGSSLCTCCTLG